MLEAIIYRTGSSRDLSYELAASEFRNCGFAVVEVPTGANLKDVEGDVKLVHKPNEYSSIHIVLWANGLVPGFRVPAEVQIRTAFEDIWSELQRELHHKVQIGDPGTLPDDRKKFFQNAQTALEELKVQVDGCARTAALIRRQVQLAFEGVVNVRARTDTLDAHKLLTLGLKKSIQDKLNKAAAQLKNYYNTRSRRVRGRRGSTYDERAAKQDVVKLEGAARLLEEAFEDYKAHPSSEAAVDKEVRYFIPMEIARTHYVLGMFYSSGVAARGEDDRTEPRSYFEEALERYVELEASGMYSDDPVLTWRIGETLAVRGNHDVALLKLEEAVDKLRDNSYWPDNHLVRVQIPRRLGMAYWDAAERLKLEARRLGGPDLHSRRRQELNIRAYEVTWAVLERKVEVSEDAWYKADTEREKRITINNLLDYAVEYLKAGGAQETIMELGFSKEFARAGLALIRGVKKPTFADTERAVAAYLGDDRRERAADKRVLTMLDQHEWGDLYSREVLEEMRREAEASLERLGRVGAKRRAEAGRGRLASPRRG